MTLTRFLILPAAVLTLALPPFAQDAMMGDMSTMTCGDLMKMDKDGMMKAADNMDMMMQMDAMSDADKAAMAEKMKAETAGMTEAQMHEHMMMAMQDDMKMKMDAMTDDQKAEHMKMTEASMTKMETACKGHDDMTVTDAMGSM